MGAIERKKTADQHSQETSDKEWVPFVFQLMMAFELQNYVEKSLQNYSLISNLDKLLLGVEEELFNLGEEIDV